MLRLQPSEIGLTATEVQNFRRRQDARRRARVQALNDEVLGPSGQYPVIQHGPARLRDVSLVRPSRAVGPAYSVFDSSDEDQYGTIDVENDPASESVEPLVGEDGDPVESETESEREARMIMHDSNFQLHIEISPKDERAESEIGPPGGDGAYRDGQQEPAQSSTTLALQNLSHFRSSYSPRPELDANLIPLQLDGASHTHAEPAHTDFGVNHRRIPLFQRRRFRPRSQSDPCDTVIPPLTLHRQRKQSPEQPRPRRRSSVSSAEDLHCVSSSESQSAEFQDLVTESSSWTNSHEDVPTSTPSLEPTVDRPQTASYSQAACLALRNSPSPLDKIAHGSLAMSPVEANWHHNLAFRTRFQTPLPIDQPCASNREQLHDNFGDEPATPFHRHARCEPDMTPKPTVIRVGRYDLYDGNNDAPQLLTQSNAESGASSQNLSTAPIRSEPRLSDRRSTPSSLQPDRLERHDLQEHAIRGSPQRTTLCRRNAVHHSSSSIDSTDANGWNPSASPVRRRRPRRVAPATRTSPRLPNSPDVDRLQVSAHVLQTQRVRFLCALAQANGGRLPHDADRRWMQFLEQLASSNSDYLLSRYDGDNGLSGSSEQDLGESSEASFNDNTVEGASDPFSQPASPQRPRPYLPRPPPPEFSIARGGGPLSELPFVQRPPVPRRSALRSTSTTSDQENMDDAAWDQFEGERRIRQWRSRGGVRRNGADGDESSDSGTPPRAGRLERFLG